MELMDKIIEKLKQDEHYYGDYGKQFLSNSDINILLKNPKLLHKQKERTTAMVVGGYFHTAILEPDKLKRFKVIDSSTRNTKKYKEMSDGEICLLQHEVDKIELMTEAIMDNKICGSLIMGTDGKLNDFEVPGVTEIFGNKWKGKADIINHNEQLVIDLKTTSDIDRFRWSASKFNYDSQAYIYSNLFGYEMLFMVIDKETHQIGLFDCSPDFYKSGEEKVRKATDAYDLFFKTEDFDSKQYLITKTL
jgi:hypothetical protein